ncbi:hypothetical protein [Rhizobium sp. RM]|uniref:hypothetical protein n=1 Tax=Rhizobium sp. RM TaxID=2748079 RepID=UPI00110F0F7E|nr:hypothetical protein [Rhizobium sp. RM]NWJ27399.1 hypothetical protein [Rhizobium sp. RM]TMV20450.1 hypothetical protein BJG94_10555 [Rhizobium sp. Td3]
MLQALQSFAFDLIGSHGTAHLEPSPDFDVPVSGDLAKEQEKTDLELERKEISEIAFATFGFHPML